MVIAQPWASADTRGRFALKRKVLKRGSAGAVRPVAGNAKKSCKKRAERRSCPGATILPKVGEMKLLVFSSLVLMAAGAAAQNPPTVPATPDTCYTLRRYRVKRSEKPQPLSKPLESTTCTPASRFKVKYLPSTAEPREPQRTKCVECDKEPRPEEKK